MTQRLVSLCLCSSPAYPSVRWSLGLVGAQMRTWTMSFQQGPMEWDESADSCHAFDMRALSALNYLSPPSDDSSSASPAQSQGSTPTQQPHDSPGERTITMLDEGNLVISFWLWFLSVSERLTLVSLWLDFITYCTSLALSEFLQSSCLHTLFVCFCDSSLHKGWTRLAIRALWTKLLLLQATHRRLLRTSEPGVQSVRRQSLWLPLWGACLWGL